jgi:hypothetical protein
MKKQAILGISALLLALAPGCEQMQEPVREAREGLEERVEALGPELDELRARVDAEVRKLKAVEYRVETVPATAMPDQVAARLNELGAERWDCFHVETLGLDRILYLKRPVRTALRGVPHADLLRHLPEKDGNGGGAEESGGPDEGP